MIQELADRIWSHPEFHSEYRELVCSGIASGLPLSSNSTRKDTFDLHRVVQSACHLAGSTVTSHREAAYRVGIYAHRLAPSEWDSLPAVLSVIFSRLGNFPAVTYLQTTTGNVDEIAPIPFATSIDIDFHRAANTVSVGPSFNRVLTDFQKRLWSKLDQPHPTAVSAPTSAGKSFALLNYVASRIRQNLEQWALFIVPTRALIGQVSGTLNDLFNQLDIADDTIVTEIPTSPKEQGAQGGVYVLTQERTQILLETAGAPMFTLVVADEAQGVGDDGRGVLLQTVIEKLLKTNKHCKILFSAPLVTDPRVFGTLFGLDGLESLSEQESPVAQNLIFVDTDPVRRNVVKLSLAIGSEREPLGEATLPIELADDDQTLAVLSWALGKDKQNIVYAGGKARCEVLSNLISQLVVDVNISPELDEFSQFIRDHVHKDYLLAETVKRRVGFHYGNMPSVVRKELEFFSSNGTLRHLVCTSTLLQGVNLPASNLFLLKPTKGRDREEATDVLLDGGDFWNLAGRAGRLGKEFEGNVFLVDTPRWSNEPFSENREQPVVGAFAQIVRESPDKLIQFIENRTHASGRRDFAGIENTFVKLANSYRSGDFQTTIRRCYLDNNAEAVQRLEEAISVAVSELTLANEVVERNPTISVFRQQELYDYLLGRIDKGEVARIMPVHPLRPEAYDSVMRLFYRVHTIFEKKPKKNQSHTFFATLALKWMRGEPLPMIIEEQFQRKNKRAKKGTPSIATVIRETFDLIERDVRFRYVKFVKCYIDILIAALQDRGQEELLPSVVPLHLFLELGASSQTMLNLIGMGLTRTTAGIVTEAAVDKSMDRTETARWLHSTNWKAQTIPTACRRELDMILASGSK